MLTHLQVLKKSFQAQSSLADREVFTKLFRCWCHNPVATLSLCLLAQAYDLAAVLVQKFAEVKNLNLLQKIVLQIGRHGQVGGVACCQGAAVAGG